LYNPVINALSSRVMACFSADETAFLAASVSPIFNKFYTFLVQALKFSGSTCKT